MFLYVCYTCSYNNINKLQIQNHLSSKLLCKDVQNNINVIDVKKHMLNKVSFKKYILLQQLIDKENIDLRKCSD
jgi:hypothetical protein